MTRVLLLLNMPEDLRNAFHAPLAQRFTDVQFDLVDHVAKVDPYLAGADVLMTHGPYLSTRSDEVLSRMPRLRWVQGTGTGLDNIIDRPSLAHDVVVTNMRGAHGPQMSEAAIASMLALARQLPRSIRNQDKAMWERWLPRTIHGKTVGIVGIGVIAEALAPRCKALGMTVIGFSGTTRDVAGFDEVHATADLKQHVGRIEYLVLLAPYSPATHHIVNADVLKAMKPGSFLINLARGGVLDEVALADAIRHGPVEGAALDVFSQEPLPTDNVLWSIPEVIMTCHMGGLANDYHLQALPIIENNLAAFLEGSIDKMVNVVRR